jgi:hypothetical protein
MADIAWFLVSLGDYVGVFISWFFLIAFLFNLVSSINHPNKSRLILSSIMMISYLSTNFIDIVITTELTPATHIDYFIFDIATIFTLLLFNFFSQYKSSTAFCYLIVGLTINASSYLGMHYDIHIIGNRDLWWFWILHIFGIHFIDITMALVLIFNKDFLGLMRGLRKFKLPYRSYF